MKINRKKQDPRNIEIEKAHKQATNQAKRLSPPTPLFLRGALIAATPKIPETMDSHILAGPLVVFSLLCRATSSLAHSSEKDETINPHALATTKLKSLMLKLQL